MSASGAPSGTVATNCEPGDGKRKTVRIGKASRKQAEAFRVKLENLVTAHLTKGAMDDETARWVAGLEDRTYNKLVAVGLLEPRVKAPTTEPTPCPTRLSGNCWTAISRLGMTSSRTLALS